MGVVLVSDEVVEVGWCHDVVFNAFAEGFYGASFVKSEMASGVLKFHFVHRMVGLGEWGGHVDKRRRRGCDGAGGGVGIGM